MHLRTPVNKKYYNLHTQYIAHSEKTCWTILIINLAASWIQSKISFYFLESSKESNVHPHNIHTTWQWTHSGKRLRMCEIVCWWRKDMAQIESWDNKHIFKKIKQRRISFVLGYLRMILWNISSAISIKHRIFATFNIKQYFNSDSLYAFKDAC
jgi:hypothetical protein